MNLLPVILLLAPLLAPGQGIQAVKYKLHARVSYHIRSEVLRNSEPVTRTLAVAEQEVVADSGSLAESVRWIRKRLLFPDPILMDSIAAATPAYRVSLLPGGRLDFPTQAPEAMDDEIRDLHLFYLAISPSLGLIRLGPQRLSLHDTTILVAHDYASGKRMENCLQVSQRLLVRDRSITIVQTTFRPGPFNCLEPLRPEAGQPSTGIVNYQVFQPGDSWVFTWGSRECTIISTLDNRSGRLLKAELKDQYNLRTLRSGGGLSAPSPVYTITRLVNLEASK